jgi:small subunit ribosomal protein S6
MAATPPIYDLMLLLDPAAPDEQRSKIRADVDKILSSNGANVVGTHDWGTRKMAFEIRHKTDAEYHLIQFQGPPAIPAALARTLRITDGVIRFRVIKLAPGTPEPPPAPSAAAPEPVEAAPSYETE